MSDTTTPVPPAPPTLPADSLWTPQTIIGLYALTIGACTIAGIFFIGDKPTIAQTVGGVMTILGTVVGFYFGSSRGSQAKDERAAQPVSP